MRCRASSTAGSSASSSPIPRFGPLAFQALEDFYSGAGVFEVTIISDKEYTVDNAEAELENAY